MLPVVGKHVLVFTYGKEKLILYNSLTSETILMDKDFLKTGKLTDEEWGYLEEKDFCLSEDDCIKKFKALMTIFNLNY